MSNDDQSPQSDRRDRREAWFVFAGIAFIIAVAVVSVLIIPGFIQVHLSPGVGIKTATVIGFIVTFVVFVVFAITAGDGVFGEFPLMLAGFLFFWAIFSTSVAWVF